MLIDTQLIWDWIGKLSIVMGFIMFFWMIRMQLRFAPIMAVAERLMKQWGTWMSDKREGKRDYKRLSEAQKQARKKLTDNIRATIPFNLVKNFSDNEILGLITDQELMKGLVFIADSGQSFLKKIVGMVGGTPKEKKALMDDLPTI